MNKINILIYVIIVLVIGVLGYSLYKNQCSTKENMLTDMLDTQLSNNMPQLDTNDSKEVTNNTNEANKANKANAKAQQAAQQALQGRMAQIKNNMKQQKLIGGKDSINRSGTIFRPATPKQTKKARSSTQTGRNRSDPTTYKINSVSPNNVYIYVIDKDNQKHYITPTTTNSIDINLTTDISKAQVFNLANVTNNDSTVNVFITKEKTKALRFFSIATLVPIDQLNKMTSNNRGQYNITASISNNGVTQFINYSLPSNYSTLTSKNSNGNSDFYSIPVNLATSSPTPSQATSSPSPSPNVQPYSPSPHGSSCRLVCNDSNNIIQVHKSNYIYNL